MVKKTPIDKLSESIAAILKEYGDDVAEATRECSKRVTKAGVKAVKASARQSFETSRGGEYVSGWTSQFETGRLSAQGTIYNKKVPGLPHLLEHGHVSRNGTGRTFGTVQGRIHIAPVERQIVKDFERNIKTEVSRV